MSVAWFRRIQLVMPDKMPRSSFAINTVSLLPSFLIWHDRVDIGRYTGQMMDGNHSMSCEWPMENYPFCHAVPWSSRPHYCWLALGFGEILVWMGGLLPLVSYDNQSMVTDGNSWLSSVRQAIYNVNDKKEIRVFLTLKIGEWDRYVTVFDSTLRSATTQLSLLKSIEDQ